MVGASELPFRLLCRRYGAQLAYTPMMSSTKFATCPHYRSTIFQTTPDDHPLVAHFSANDPEEFAAAAKTAEGLKCDAIDLNLGCPQRTAYLGHFGSYLLEETDRELLVRIVRRACEVVRVPVFCKIRLLDELEDTIRLCRQLKEAGASLIAIHARYRASWERKGAGARDGPAMLDQVKEIKRVMGDFPILANGNVITYSDVVDNLESTGADGIMSAEGILDDPALFLPSLSAGGDVCGNETVHSNCDDGSNAELVEKDEERAKKKRKLMKKMREINKIEEKIKMEGGESINPEQKKKLSTKSDVEEELNKVDSSSSRISTSKTTSNDSGDAIDTEKVEEHAKKRRKLIKKMREIYKIEDRIKSEGKECVNPEEEKKLFTKSKVEEELKKLDSQPIISKKSNNQSPHSTTTQTPTITATPSKLTLAKEYLTLVKKHPTELRSVIFHIRRMCRDLLTKYQLMDDCINAPSTDKIHTIISQIQNYQDNPQSFVYDQRKAQMEKTALARKKQEEGKRKAFEARMIRKAKREKRDDLMFYLRQGADVPSVEIVKKLKGLEEGERMEYWKKHHGQHCMAFHFNEGADSGGCKRGRGCAFLHVDCQKVNDFEERDEVAG